MRPPGDVDFADGDTPPTMGGTGPGSAPTTEYREVPLGGYSAAVAQVGDEGAHVDRQGNILFRRGRADPASRTNCGGRSGCAGARSALVHSSGACLRCRSARWPHDGSWLQLFAEYIFASGVGEPMAVEGDFGAV
jgi:hypothetical protein